MNEERLVGHAPVTMGYTHGSNISTVNRNWGPPAAETNGDYSIIPNKRRFLSTKVPPLRGQNNLPPVEIPPFIPVTIQLKKGEEYVSKRTQIKDWVPAGYVIPPAPYRRRDLASLRTQGISYNATMAAIHNKKVEEQFVRAIHDQNYTEAEALRRKAIGSFDKDLDEIKKQHEQEVRRHYKLPPGSAIPQVLPKGVHLTQRPENATQERLPGKNIDTSVKTEKHPEYTTDSVVTFEGHIKDLVEEINQAANATHAEVQAGQKEEAGPAIAENGHPVESFTTPTFLLSQRQDPLLSVISPEDPALRALIHGLRRHVDERLMKIYKMPDPELKRDYYEFTNGKNVGQLRLLLGLFYMIQKSFEIAASHFIHEAETTVLRGDVRAAQEELANGTPESQRSAGEFMRKFQERVSLANNFKWIGRYYDRRSSFVYGFINEQGGVGNALVVNIALQWRMMPTFPDYLKRICDWASIPYRDDYKFSNADPGEPVDRPVIHPETPSGEGDKPKDIGVFVENEDPAEEEKEVPLHTLRRGWKDNHLPSTTEFEDGRPQKADIANEQTGSPDTAVPPTPIQGEPGRVRTEPTNKAPIHVGINKRPPVGAIPSSKEQRQFTTAQAIDANVRGAQQNQPAMAADVKTTTTNPTDYVDAKEPGDGQEPPPLESQSQFPTKRLAAEKRMQLEENLKGLQGEEWTNAYFHYFDYLHPVRDVPSDDQRFAFTFRLLLAMDRDDLSHEAMKRILFKAKNEARNQGATTPFYPAIMDERGINRLLNAMTPARIQSILDEFPSEDLLYTMVRYIKGFGTDDDWRFFETKIRQYLEVTHQEYENVFGPSFTVKQEGKHRGKRTKPSIAGLPTSNIRL
jgi:hypothetical protein